MPQDYLDESIWSSSGAKSVMIGDDVYEYDGGQVAVYLLDLPVASQVTRASHAAPYLTLKITFDPQRITELAAKVFPHGAPQPKDNRALFIGQAGAHIIDAATRLIELMRRPGDAELIAPLAIDEILIRLVRSPMGSRIAQMGQAESNLRRVAKAVRSMSPLQLQKALRLQEARRLMLTAMLDAGAAGRRVGYISASQFAREYGRFFGASPAKDIHRLREQGLAAAETTAA